MKWELRNFLLVKLHAKLDAVLDAILDAIFDAIFFSIESGPRQACRPRENY